MYHERTTSTGAIARRHYNGQRLNAGYDDTPARPAPAIAEAELNNGNSEHWHEQAIVAMDLFEDLPVSGMKRHAFAEYVTAYFGGKSSWRQLYDVYKRAWQVIAVSPDGTVEAWANAVGVLPEGPEEAEEPTPIIVSVEA